MKQVTLTIKTSSIGIMVYDKNAKDSIDIFPHTKEGHKRFINFMTSLGVNNPEQYLE